MLPDIIAGIVVAAAFLIGLWIAYRRGFHAALPVRSELLDFLATDLLLHHSHWQGAAEPAGTLSEAPGTTLGGVELQIEQAGSRIVGTGRHADGNAWQLEGLVYQRQVICMTHGFEPNQPGPGLLLLRGDALGHTLTGYRITWDRQGSLLSLREIALSRKSTGPQVDGALPGNKPTPVT